MAPLSLISPALTPELFPQQSQDPMGLAPLTPTQLMTSDSILNPYFSPSLKPILPHTAPGRDVMDMALRLSEKSNYETLANGESV
jgi:hypothetical protein